MFYNKIVVSLKKKVSPLRAIILLLITKGKNSLKVMLDHVAIAKCLPFVGAFKFSFLLLDENANGLNEIRNTSIETKRLPFGL